MKDKLSCILSLFPMIKVPAGCTPSTSVSKKRAQEKGGFLARLSLVQLWCSSCGSKLTGDDRRLRDQSLKDDADLRQLRCKRKVGLDR
jgi:hypothetical protein